MTVLFKDLFLLIFKLLFEYGGVVWLVYISVRTRHQMSQS